MYLRVQAHGSEKRGRVVNQRVDRNEVLEEHHAPTDVRTLLASLLETVCPRLKLELDAADEGIIMKPQVLGFAGLLVEGDLSMDLDRLLLDSLVIFWPLPKPSKRPKPRHRCF